jgi:hypothetical protein
MSFARIMLARNADFASARPGELASGAMLHSGTTKDTAVYAASFSTR